MRLERRDSRAGVGAWDGGRGHRLFGQRQRTQTLGLAENTSFRAEADAYPRNRIGAGKITALLAVKSVDAGALRHTSNHVGDVREGTPCSLPSGPCSGER